MKKILISAAMILTMVVWTFATPGFSEEAITGRLLGIKLKIKKSDGKEEQIDATEINKIWLGDKIIINNGMAEKDSKGAELTDIELFYNDISSKKVSTHVKKAKKIKIGDDITIKNGKAKEKGARGC